MENLQPGELTPATQPANATFAPPASISREFFRREEPAAMAPVRSRLPDIHSRLFEDFRC
jgi:hypothetical protein